MTGEAVEDADTGRIKRLKVADIEPLEVETKTESIDADKFWCESSIENLASEQQVMAAQNLDSLIGAGTDLWEDDQDLESFVADIYRRRRAGQDGEEDGR